VVGQEVIERVRLASDIVEVISDFVTLKRAGKSFKGLCPFHSEKTPSFMVSPEKQVYHCFGCGAGGNVFTFIMEHEKLSFPEALRMLAERAGIEVPRSSGEGRDRLEPLYEALAASAAFYHGRLKTPGEGDSARKYLEGRGITAKTIDEFGLGYAPPGWENLASHLKRRFPEESLVRAGLLVSRRGGGYYDRFRNRIMFPVRNALGKVVGFGARALGDEQPKYLNSPDSPVYSKSHLLYGLYHSKDHIRSEGVAVAVEGYTDFLALYRSGIRNAVATAGTSFTEGHGRVLSRFCSEVLLCYDGDAPGVAAAVRASEALLRAGLEVKVVLLPAGEDPDSFAGRIGPERLKSELLSRSLRVVEFLMEKDRGKPKSEFLREAVSMIAQIPEAIPRRCLVQELAEKTAFDEVVLAGEVERFRRGGKVFSNNVPESRESARVPKPEAEFLALCLEVPSVFSKSRDLLTQDDFSSPAAREVWDLMNAASASGEEMTAEALVNRTGKPGVRAFISSLSFGGASEIEEPEKAGLDYVRKLKQLALRKELAEVDRKLRNENSEGAVKELLRKKQELAEELRGWKGM